MPGLVALSCPTSKPYPAKQTLLIDIQIQFNTKPWGVWPRFVHTVGYRLSHSNGGSSPSSTQKQAAQTLPQKHANTSCQFLGFSYLLICNLMTSETVSFNIPL